MYIHVNTERVIIDATENARYVERNVKTGRLVATTHRGVAIGILGSGDIIRQFAEVLVAPGWDAVADVIPVVGLPEDYEPGKYVYENGDYREYEGTAELSARELSVKAKESAEGIAENSAGLFEVAELADENSYSIFDLAEYAASLEERIERLEGKA